MSTIVEVFKDDLLQALGPTNIILIHHHGSRVRGEARSDSDYDTILVLNEIDEERKARLVYFQLKDAYFYLRSIAYYKSGSLVSTRKELTLRLAELPVDRPLATELLQTLELYEEHESKIAENLDEYLFKLEKFFRATRV